jgi:hypothetical protein
MHLPCNARACDRRDLAADEVGPAPDRLGCAPKPSETGERP